MRDEQLESLLFKPMFVKFQDDSSHLVLFTRLDTTFSLYSEGIDIKQVEKITYIYQFLDMSKTLESGTPVWNRQEIVDKKKFLEILEEVPENEAKDALINCGFIIYSFMAEKSAEYMNFVQNLQTLSSGVKKAINIISPDEDHDGMMKIITLDIKKLNGGETNEEEKSLKIMGIIDEITKEYILGQNLNPDSNDTISDIKDKLMLRTVDRFAGEYDIIHIDVNIDVLKSYIEHVNNFSGE